MKNLLKIMVVSSLFVVGCLLIAGCGGGAEQFVQGQGQIDIYTTDNTTKLALASVKIEVSNSSGGVPFQTVSTDSSGYYKFLGTVGSDYYFTFSKAGYATQANVLKTPQLTNTQTLNVAM